MHRLQLCRHSQKLCKHRSAASRLRLLKRHLIRENHLEQQRTRVKTKTCRVADTKTRVRLLITSLKAPNKSLHGMTVRKSERPSWPLVPQRNQCEIFTHILRNFHVVLIVISVEKTNTVILAPFIV